MHVYMVCMMCIYVYLCHLAYIHPYSSPLSSQPLIQSYTPYSYLTHFVHQSYTPILHPFPPLLLPFPYPYFAPPTPRRGRCLRRVHRQAAEPADVRPTRPQEAQDCC